MKDQYLGDLNDYRKYGLLRILSDGGRFRIGVCWMLTADDGKGDGQNRGYLLQEGKYRFYDHELFDHLYRIVVTNRGRSVRLVQDEAILPGAAFFDELLTDDRQKRADYLARGLQRLGGTDLIFFDPDNGIETGSTHIGRKGSSKYVYWHEVRDAFASGRSVLVYQHFPREKRSDFIARMVTRYRLELGVPEVYAFCTPQVVFFLAARQEHVDHVLACASLVDDRWGRDHQITSLPSSLDEPDDARLAEDPEIRRAMADVRGAYRRGEMIPLEDAIGEAGRGECPPPEPPGSEAP